MDPMGYGFISLSIGSNVGEYVLCNPFDSTQKKWISARNNRIWLAIVVLVYV